MEQEKGLLGSARELYREHKFLAALAAYEAILASGAESAEAYRGRADALVCLSRYEEAIAPYEQSISIDSSRPETFRELADTLYGLRRFREAIENYKNAARMYSEEGSRAKTDAQALTDPSEVAKKRVEINEAAEKYSDACNELGFSYLCIRDYESAIDVLNLAIENGKQYPYAYHTLASVFWAQGNYAAALSEWNKARKLYSKCRKLAREKKWTGHFLYFGDLLYDVFGKLDKAEEIYKEGLELDANNLKIWIGLVTLRLERKDDNTKHREKAHSDARTAYRKARSLIAEDLKSSADVESLVLAGELALTMKEHEEAEKFLKEALKKDEAMPEGGRYAKSAKPNADMGILCMRREKYAEAIEYFEAGITIAPDDLSLRSNLAEAYLRDEQFEEAEIEFQRVLNSAPNHIESRIGLGGVYTALGETGDTDMFEAAIIQYTDAIRLATLKIGSRRLKKKELAAVFYSRGYARVNAYEASKALRDRSHLYCARSDFRDCFRNDPDQYRAKRAVEKIDKVLPPRSPRRFMEEWGPFVILGFSVAVFLLSQLSFIWSFLDKSKIPSWLGFLNQAQQLPTSEYIALTFGSLVLMVASSYLPQLLKLKVPGIELEKSAQVDQITVLGPIGISKAS